MKWVTAKSEEQINTGLPSNIYLELESADGTHHSLTLYVDEVPIVSAKKANYSMAVYVPKPPEYEDKWALTGTFAKLSVNEIFDSQHEAKDRLEELQDLNKSECQLTIEKVIVAKEE